MFKYRLATFTLLLFLCAGGVLVHGAYFSPVEAVALPDLSERTHLSFIALGDAGSGRLGQFRVAHAMEQVAEREEGLDFVAFLGDNFYGSGVDSVGDTQWLYKFEHMYSGVYLSRTPFYVLLGNHDYRGNWLAQIAYTNAATGSGRWQLPNRFYVKDFGTSNGRPLLRMVFIDTNGDAADVERQARFVERQMSAEPRPIWKIVAGHFPIRDQGKHGDNPTLARLLLPSLNRAGIDLYLAGHDHNLQFLKRPTEPAYVVSGGGGQSLYKLRSAQPGDYVDEARGFARIDVDADRLQLKFYDDRGEALAAFAKDRYSSNAFYRLLSL